MLIYVNRKGRDSFHAVLMLLSRPGIENNIVLTHMVINHLIN